MKPGARIEVPLTLKRLYGFADPVQVYFLGVHNISGITAPPIMVAAGKADGRLVIEALANAPPGTFVSPYGEPRLQRSAVNCETGSDFYD